MTTTPPEAPADPGHDAGHDTGHDTGPRVNRGDVRDVARLRRTRVDRKIAGVAGGLARHLDVDPIVTRVVLAVLFVFGGAGLLVYAVLWLVVPVEDTDEAVVRLDDRSRTVAVAVTGVIAALALLGDSLGGWGFPWPLAICGAVVLAVLFFRGEPRVHPLLRQGWQGTPPTTAYAPPPSPVHATVKTPPRRRGPVLFWYALALIAIGLGTLGAVDLAGADVTDSAYPALALGVCALLLVVGAFWGRAGGLILLGLLSAAATAASAAVDEVDAGRLASTPSQAVYLDESYRLTFGEIALDLTEVTDPEALDGRTVELEVEVAGRIEVRVPDGVDVVVESSVDAGERRVFGESRGEGSGTNSLDGGPDAPELTLDVRVALGEIEIIHEETR